MTWDSRGLQIEAYDSSLNQILCRVAAATGAKLEGLSQDYRIFGSYGPGRAGEVLWKLLNGSGYNVIIIGRRDVDVPLGIVLSARISASSQAASDELRHENVALFQAVPSRVDSTQPQNAQTVENPFGNGDPPRDPQQFMQEILQRQPNIDRQQQQENNPHP